MYITVIIAQTVGIFCFILSILMLSCMKRFKSIFSSISADSEAVFYNSLAGLLMACFLLVIHNNWANDYLSGISLVGWTLFIKSILWLTMPEKMVLLAKQIVSSETAYILLSLLTMITGLCFLICGFGPIWPM